VRALASKDKAQGGDVTAVGDVERVDGHCEIRSDQQMRDIPLTSASVADNSLLQLTDVRVSQNGGWCGL
jgi:hypothetical protein